MPRKEVNSVVYDAAHIIQTEADLEAKTATVKNVVTGEEYAGGGGGGDFGTAEVKVVSREGQSCYLYIANLAEGFYPRGNVMIWGEDEAIITAILYEGRALAEMGDLEGITRAIVSGDIEQPETFVFEITGNGTITLE